jgi:hypothetical protein
MAISYTALSLDNHQTTLGKDLDMPGDGWPADVKMLRNTVKGKTLPG